MNTNPESIQESNLSHEELIAQVKDQMPDEETLYDLAELFKVFGDTTRVRIMCALFEQKLSVTDISELLSMGQSAISHQLRLLRSARLVRSRRDGKMAYYSLDDEHVRQIFDKGLAHIEER